MKHKIIIGVLLIVAIFSFSSLAVASDVTLTELTDTEIAENSGYSAGSDVVLFAPNSMGGGWITSKEPVKAHWTIYDPGMHQVTQVSKTLTTKWKGSDDKWRSSDRFVFTLPAFAQKGLWSATCEFEMIDGSRFDAISADFLYVTFPCDHEGDVLGNIFMYPWYLFGWKSPAIFWFPLIIFWGPVAYLGIATGLSRVFPNFVDITRDSVDRFRKSVRGGKRSKKRKPTK